jgi:hypothetical protein
MRYASVVAFLVLSATKSYADASMHCINSVSTKPDYDVSYVGSTLRIIIAGRGPMVFPNVFSNGPLKVEFPDGLQLEATMWDGRPYGKEGPHTILRDVVGNVIEHDACDQLREW